MNKPCWECGSQDPEYENYWGVSFCERCDKENEEQTQHRSYKMTKRILFLITLIMVTGCDGDDPFINFKPYREAPLTGKDNIGQETKDEEAKDGQ